ncbi:MAG: SAM-dependent chlorinase/fluorinase [Gammaproteobacteria bacterium]|nr:SAM-dependent chlorinase/fluorinase [Gammaproteobacteria bacterium]
MIALFTDFGLHDPYVGQLHAVLAQQAPGVPVIDLFHAVPNYDIRAAAYLLPAYTALFPPETIVVCVVDPGVGSARRAVMVRADGRWYVGPDNGLFHVLAQRAGAADSHEILWRPAQLSASFHGRDLFAPVAATLARGETPRSEPAALTPPPGEWPEDLAQVVYIDHYGNAVTGVRAAGVDRSRRIRVDGRVLANARTFSVIPAGQACWYENANGLIEFAVNRGDAAQTLGLRLGDSFEIER